MTSPGRLPDAVHNPGSFDGAGFSARGLVASSPRTVAVSGQFARTAIDPKAIQCQPTPQQYTNR